MKSVAVLLLVSFAASAWACEPCETMKWGTCDGNPCECTLMIGDGQKQPVDCKKLVPKCFLMKAEMHRARTGKSTRTGGKPTDDAIVDNDGIYDPECENTGTFKALQCNNTEECWCVNSAGVRRTDKGDKSLKCDKLVETYWVRVQLKHKPVAGSELDKEKLKTAIATVLKDQYFVAADVAKDIEVDYDKDARLIIMDMKKEKTNKEKDLASAAYYMEKDVKVLPLFENQTIRFEPVVDGKKLEMEEILVYYVDAEPPTFTMRRLTGGVIAVIVVVILAIIAGLLILYFTNKRDKARYQKTQVREMDEMPK